MHTNARRKLRHLGLTRKSTAPLSVWFRLYHRCRPVVGTRARLRAGEKICLVQAYTNERGHHCLRRIFSMRWPSDFSPPPVTTATTPACRGYKSVFG